VALGDVEEFAVGGRLSIEENLAGIEEDDN
jgi:hypothetical protein